MIFPTLYKKSSTGATQRWDISVDGATLITRWGQVTGAIQETRDVVAEGKNLGKKNATTAAEQALAEARARHEKQRKKGYVLTLDDAIAGNLDAVITGGIVPMLAHRFDEQGHKLHYPCFAQPKLDGHRCIVVVEPSGRASMWSRTRKPIATLPHIAKAIEDLRLPAGTMLDGELYQHEYRERFEEITSFIRGGGPGSDVVQYHIYDLPSSSSPFEDRTRELGALVPIGGPLRIVETLRADDEDALMVIFDYYLTSGYEGAMARNTAGKYVNKRSYDLLKIKEFIDSEFNVTGVEQGRGKLAGCAIFVCATSEGSEFRVKMKGATEALRPYFERPETAIGRALTVKYQGLTGKNGVPRFPVALRFKEDV